MQLVKVSDIAPDATVDLAYQRADNVAGRRLYATDFSAQLDEPAAQALRSVTQVLK